MGTDSIILQHWLIHFREAIGEICYIVTDFVECLANNQPPCSACQALMSVRLIGLDDNPAVHPVGLGKTWQRMMTKYVLKVAVQEVKEACGKYQLF